jgi:LAO/AO transport system kinase
MREIFEQRLLAAFKNGRQAAKAWAEIEEKVRAGRTTPGAAAEQLARVAGIGTE